MPFPLPLLLLLLQEVNVASNREQQPRTTSSSASGMFMLVLLEVSVAATAACPFALGEFGALDVGAVGALRLQRVLSIVTSDNSSSESCVSPAAVLAPLVMQPCTACSRWRPTELNLQKEVGAGAGACAVVLVPSWLCALQAR